MLLSEIYTLTTAELGQLRPAIAAAVQIVYDQWIPSEDDCGGICDEVAQTIIDIILDKYPDLPVDIGGFDGDDHAYVTIYADDDRTDPIYNIDIPYDLYEVGGGYRWSKLPNVRFTASDVLIDRL